MSKRLFDEFSPVSSKAWKQKIQVDLKGADYNETLIWKTQEGIDVKPFYHSDELPSLPQVSSTSAKDWKIAQAIDANGVDKANTEAKQSIENGAEFIIFNQVGDNTDIKSLINGIDVPIHINFSILSQSNIKQLSELGLEKFSINNDIIGNLGKTGNWFHNLKEDHQILEKSVSVSNAIQINTEHYQNAGAHSVQQLAYAIAHANEYLNHFNEQLSTTKKESLTINFNVSIGSNYFFEIAKLRALRLLWSTLSKAYGFNSDCVISATPSKRNKTIYDYNVNMLRTTTECMSAVLGGANIVCNQPYNYLFQESTEFGERIARNQLLVLKKESYFDVVNNPSDGSYYIESLTNQMAEKALEIFKSIEKNGGFLNQLKDGTIQRKLKESAAKEQEQFDNGDITLLGTNKHPNAADKMKSAIEKQPFMKVEKRKTLIEPIIEKRLSEKLEINRLNEE
ncbi:MAG: methylmalonyl-CoA mutase [Winogradskyella sp.]|uniref:methylmalonyl-CoA mutase subunit beta n=1 Tax=Winogradskyella sp. TaxID=1883156 RepID=UPI000F3DCB72|nr:methylmalonyl-CoA mutase subunit beta [Winogradskyella sp.]RNC84844.1 MAG: methylmalonyl-CoA mutase [Winogradskyella sp.]